MVSLIESAPVAAPVSQKKFTLVLAHVANCDIGGGYWETPVDPKKMVVGADTLVEARALFEAWVSRNGLGGGNMSSRLGTGNVREGRKVIARFSYNGRLWTTAEFGTPEHKEIDVQTGEVIS